MTRPARALHIVPPPTEGETELRLAKALEATKRLAAAIPCRKDEEWFGAFHWKRRVEHEAAVLRARAGIGFGEGVRT